MAYTDIKCHIPEVVIGNVTPKMVHVQTVAVAECLDQQIIPK
jgi:hypothetical protein